jgi:hypothetical protein
MIVIILGVYFNFRFRFSKEFSMPKKSVKKAVKKSAKKAVKKSVKKTKKKSAAPSRVGRQIGSGKYGGCETKVIRVPTFLEHEIREFAIQKIKSEKSAKEQNK